MRFLTLLFVLVTSSGCYQSFDGADDPRPVFDAGVVRDVGPPERDARPPVDPDAGPADPRPGDVCEDGEQIRPPAVSCRAETRRCIEDCVDLEPECQERCLSEDPACVTCVNARLLACFNDQGCQAEWDEFACCTEAFCPDDRGVDRLNCLVPRCEGLLDQYSDCVNSGFFCEDEPSLCFR
ncbi:MAG: hypothetical protein AB8I08_29635 [Sandaracinaceae bacterium]